MPAVEVAGLDAGAPADCADGDAPAVAVDALGGLHRAHEVDRHAPVAAAEPARLCGPEGRVRRQTMAR